MLKQWKSDEETTKDKVGQVEGVLLYLILTHFRPVENMGPQRPMKLINKLFWTYIYSNVAYYISF